MNMDNTQLLESIPNIYNRDELFTEMPIIHRVASNLSADPHVPILSERNIDVELTCMQHEHYIEHETLDNFPGIEAHQINDIIHLTRHRDKIIADIDGKGSINTIPPPEPHLYHILQYHLNKIRK